MEYFKEKVSKTEKQRWVSQWQASGLSRKAFSDAHGLRYNSFKQWVRALQPVSGIGSDAPASCPPAPLNAHPAFVAVQVEHNHPKNQQKESNLPVMEISLSNGSRVSFYQTVPIDYLRDLLK